MTTPLQDAGIVQVDGRQVGSKRYAPTSVIRSIYQSGHWVEIERYEDATVQGLGQNHRLGDCREAMLRAYSGDPEDERIHGDESYRQGNGIHLNTGKRLGKSLQGMVVDCDSDIAVKRVVMNCVVGWSDYGHGNVTYTGIVSFEERGAWGSGSREVNEWTGRGDLSQIRFEQWDVRLVDDDEDEDD